MLCVYQTLGGACYIDGCNCPFVNSPSLQRDYCDDYRSTEDAIYDGEIELPEDDEEFY